MNKKAFTLIELLLVVVIISILAVSAIPFMFRSFGGFNEITTQETIVNSLQEVSTVITRRIIFDNETASLNNINGIINSLAANTVGNNYELPSGVIIKKVTNDDVKTYTYKKNGSNVEVSDCLRITLKGSKGEHNHTLNFIVFPATR